MTLPLDSTALAKKWLAALKPASKTKVSQWAQAHRYLPAEVSAEPGPWRNERTPYLVGIMDARHEPGVEEIVFVSGTQVGKSEAGRNTLGHCIDDDPGPYLLVLPDEKSAEDTVKERILPMIRQSPALARHLLPGRTNNKAGVITLDTMSIYIAWAGSPQSLASRPCRYVEFDEVDKYPAFSGDEADPVSLGTERTKTYLHRKLILKRSTPTTAQGRIWTAWLACGDQRHYYVPCPHCSLIQRFIWSQLKYPKVAEPDKVKRADAISAGKLAYYECAGCKARIDDKHKAAMLSAGEWRSTLNSASGPTQPSPPSAVPHLKSPRVGFHLNSIYSPWVTFSDMAAKWILAEGDPGATMNFRNSWLAEPDEQVQVKLRPSVVRDKKIFSGKPLIVPNWTGAILATADTQKDHFYLTIRAWGYAYRSALVHCGTAQSFAELHRICLESVFKTESGLDARPYGLLIDSGGTVSATNPETSRTNEVYEFAASDPGRIFPTKGASHGMGRPFRISKVGAAGVMLYLIDTDYYKTMLMRLIADKLEDEKSGLVEKWLPHCDVTEDYCTQLASEHQIRDRKTRKLTWALVSQGAPNHYLDCEVLQCAAAEISNVALFRAETQTPPAAGGKDEPFGPKKRW